MNTETYPTNTQSLTTASAVPKARLRGAALIAAAGLVSAALATSASAQFRQDNGRALDANPRAGSGGSNDGHGTGPAPGRGPLVTGNQIVTGNVTAGRQFRDAVGYTDPSSFRGPTAGITSDRFIRDSAGVPRGMGAPQVDLNRPTAYYGVERAAPPPVGYVPTVGASGGYVPSSPEFVNPTLGARTYNLGIDASLRPGEMVLPTLDSVTNQPTLMSASPLYGVRVWQSGVNPNDFLAPGVLDPMNPLGQPGQPGAADRFRMDPNTLRGMRDELNRVGEGQQGPGQGGLVQPLNSSEIGGNRGAGGTPGGGQQGAAGAGAGAAAGGGAGGTLASTALSSDLRSNALGGGSITSAEGTRYRLLVAPEKQTPQLAELRRRFERQHGNADVGGVEATRQFNLERAAQQRPAAGAAGQNNPQPGQPGAGAGAGAIGGARGGLVGGVRPAPAPAPTVVPGGAAQPGQPSDNAQQPNPAPGETVAPTPPAQPAPVEPVPIKSLATGVQAKGLHDLLASAEDLMRQEKYTAALDKYNAAQEVAPNNPLITLGRANAELAASYYRRAETDLRDALAAAPHLVQAQFDLKTLAGADRLQIVVKDLKELAANNPQQSRPLLLLAYIAYNTGNQDQAATYLEQAEKRTQGDDALLKAWRQNWKLPKANSEDAPDANK